jgi:probable HAF family extracellular repeat protein
MRNLLDRRTKPWALSAVVMAMAALQAVALPAQAGGVGYFFQNIGSTYRAALWAGGQFRDLGSLGGNSAFAAALNEQGTVVGESLLGDGRDLWHAFKWRNGAMTHITASLGQGFASGASGVNGVPEPGSWVLMTLGLLGLVHLRPRRPRGNRFFKLNRSKPS